MTIKVKPLVDMIAYKAREYAEHYPQSSDGRNTFLIFAEWVESIEPVDPATIRAEDVIARNGPGATAIAMLTHIAETLRAKGKAVLTTGDDFGAQVLEFVAIIDKEQDK